MHAWLVFRFDRALATAGVVFAAIAAGASLLGACTNNGSSAPGVASVDEGGVDSSVPVGLGGGSSSSGGGSFGADSAATGDGSDGGPTCTGDGGPGTFTCTGGLSVARNVPAGAGLPDGTGLVAGGWNATGGVLTSAEIYDPTTGTFTPTGGMAAGHLWGGWGASMPVLTNGKALVAGGLDVSGQLTATAELYDPATQTFTSTSPMPVAVISMYPVVLDDGSVLYTGGWNSVTPQTISELPGWSYAGNGTAVVARYDPVSGAFAMTGSLAEDRLFGCNVRLPSGDVLAIAGAQGPTLIEHNVEQYDATGGTWTTVASFTGAPFCASAFALPNNGQVLLTGTGGLTGATLPVPGVLLFNPPGPAADAGKNTIEPTTNAIASFSPTFVQLSNGDVLAFGGTLNGAPTVTAQVYGAQTNTWRTVGNLNQPRGGAVGAFMLASGNVLIVGGTDQNGNPLATAEIYHP
jgi:hypothetical protein